MSPVPGRRRAASTAWNQGLPGDGTGRSSCHSEPVGAWPGGRKRREGRLSGKPDHAGGKGLDPAPRVGIPWDSGSASEKHLKLQRHRDNLLSNLLRRYLRSRADLNWKRGWLCGEHTLNETEGHSVEWSWMAESSKQWTEVEHWESMLRTGVV